MVDGTKVLEENTELDFYKLPFLDFVLNLLGDGSIQRISQWSVP